ncbi:selenide, water dikinase SelD [Fusobacterium perfoetens]|uniref:selenide, water dikinase SelD n=1 Tax=Fusobacterium perfoetens TaxID=852 RepID=UPI001F3E210D|nr:selenide, water dikinase SelD [Fusobacterium perfoetens]
MGPEVLSKILNDIPAVKDKNLIVGYEKSDDAAVYKLTDDIAMIQTLDFFTPMVEDPYIFGQIAAANSLSDVYAMGGIPKTAMNIVCYPEKEDIAGLGEILKGGAEKVREAGAVLSGGHSIHDPETKYGLSVTGIAHPDKILKNYGSQTGDVLVLTKPLGTGIITTAAKVGEAKEKHMEEAIKNMTALNKYAGEIMIKYPVTACTDITGFGFLGHLYEMAHASEKTFVIESELVPYIEGTKEYAKEFFTTGGGQKNRKYLEGKIELDNIPFWLEEILFDPQTSGGLLFSIPSAYVNNIMKELSSLEIKSAVVGTVEDLKEKNIIVR